MFGMQSNLDPDSLPRWAAPESFHRSFQPETMLEAITAHLESLFSAGGMETCAAKICVVEFLLATGTEDDDYLYVDGVCDNSLLHRRQAAKIAQSLAERPLNDFNQLGSLAISLIKLGEYAPAIRCIERQLELVPKSDVLWNNLAWCQFRLGRPEEAMAACQKALKAPPGHSYFHHTHACILMELGKLDDSLRAIDRAILKTSPKAPQLHYLRARVLERKNDARAAVGAWKTYLKTVRAFPSHFRAVNRALKQLEMLKAGLSGWRVRRLQAKMGPPQTRTALMLRALGVDAPDDDSYPPKEEAWRITLADSTALKGWKLLQLGRLTIAERKCREALRCWPFSPLARVLDARLALQRKDTERYQRYIALANLEQLFLPVAETRLGALMAFVFLMSLVHAEKMYHAGDFVGALRQLDEVERAVPNHPMAIFLRGLVLAAQGDKGGARSLASKLQLVTHDKRALEMLMRVCSEYVPPDTASASSPISPIG